METDFIYWRHHTPIGVKIEEVTGGEDRSGALWRALALQVYQENGRDGYREMDHLPCGAPMLYGETCRISVTHTDHLLAVATLPSTPETTLDSFSQRTALGIDAERTGRTKVLNVRERFLNADELAMIKENDLESNIVAWTVKEALYKAALTPGIDWRKDIIITSLPSLDGALGSANVTIEGNEVPFILYTYRSEDYIISVAITRHTATFIKEKKN